MKQNAMKFMLLLCIGVACLVLLVVFAREFSGREAQPQPTESQITVQTSEVTEPSETVLPTETTDPVLKANPFTADDFAMDGQWMSCVTAEFSLGVDVSKYQGEIDWEQVAAAGIRFAIIRVGGRGYGQAGNLFADETAQKNYEGAKAAGLQVGAYFFSQAISPEEAVEEAEYTLEQIKSWDLDLPVVYDWEYISETARTANTDAKTVTACAEAFCNWITRIGLDAMLYVRPESQMLDLETLAAYKRWVALYSETMDYPHQFTMWQYTKTGKVPGINGDVDINIYLP